METETNELGEVYEYEYVPTNYTTWEDADRPWNSTSAGKPWNVYSNEGGWVMKTKRVLHLGEGDNVMDIERVSKDILRFGDLRLDNGMNDYALQQLEIKSQKSSLADIREIAYNLAPYGYENIRPLIPGEYTYEKALVGIRVRKNSPEVKVGFEGAILNVDVEDVVSKGTVKVESTDINNPTKVTYGKWYYNKPEELMFSIEDVQEPCVVKVLTSDAKGFTIMLQSTVDTNKYITGTVHWLANGY